jgi:soluble lytic murein transglycosylase
MMVEALMLPIQRAGRGALATSVIACLVLVAATAARAGADDELRARFRDAYFAAATGAELSDAADDAELRAYSIYPYIEAARIAKALSLADATSIEARAEDAAAFLRRHDGEPVANGVRRAWLESLARLGRQFELVERYRSQVATTRLQCQWLSSRVAIEATDGLAPAILDRWLTPAQLPSECEPAFQWLRDAGLLDTAATEGRLRLLLENRQGAFARVIARALPADRAAAWNAWADLVESPAAAIDALIAEPGLPVEFEALLDGFQRLATADPEAAMSRLEPLIDGRGLARAQASQLRRALAYGLAWDRDARALDFFARLDPAELDDYTLEWQARSALWSGDWALVHASIASMSTELRNSPAWRYWEARAAAQRGDRERARELYESILTTDNYYAAMAAARLGQDVVPHPMRLEADDDVVDAIAELAPVVRARELKSVDLPDEALAEWRYAMSMLDAEARRQSILVAADLGWFDVAVATATTEQVFFDYELLYPRPYEKIVAEVARQFRVDSALIYGIIRQESLFRADAATNAGAVGLMQLVPETARRTARGWGRPEPGREELLDPETNILLGAAHLSDLVEQFDGQLEVALAAYNAGPAVAERWLPEGSIDADVWIDNIPYNETRAYVRRVLWHSLVFKWLADRRAQDAASWLGTVSR